MALKDDIKGLDESIARLEEASVRLESTFSDISVELAGVARGSVDFASTIKTAVNDTNDLSTATSMLRGITNDDLFDGVVESGNIYEAISLLADVAGNGDERNPFDGVYTQSDFRQAAEAGQFSEELITDLLDMDEIQNLERG